MPLDLLPILFIVASKPAPEKSLSGLQQRSASQKRIAAPELCESVLWTEKKEVSPACEWDPLDVCIEFYWIVLATGGNPLLALLPARGIGPPTGTKIQASITAYSALSCPLFVLPKFK